MVKRLVTIRVTALTYHPTDPLWLSVLGGTTAPLEVILDTLEYTSTLAAIGIKGVPILMAKWRTTNLEQVSVYLPTEALSLLVRI